MKGGYNTTLNKVTFVKCLFPPYFTIMFQTNSQFWKIENNIQKGRMSKFSYLLYVWCEINYN